MKNPFQTKKFKSRGFKNLLQYCPCDGMNKLYKKNKNATSTGKSPILECPKCGKNVVIV